MRRIDEIAVPFEGRLRGIEGFRWPTQVAGNEGDLGLGDDAPRASHCFTGTEGARSAAKKGLRSREIAELRHRDAAKGERSGVVAERDALQCAEWITRGKRSRRGRDEGVQLTPLVSYFAGTRRRSSSPQFKTTFTVVVGWLMRSKREARNR